MSEKNCGRGYGACLCGTQYLCRRKPEKCGNCRRYLGGNASPSTSAKKFKSILPDSVEISSVFFSVKSSTRDDRCLVVKDSSRFVCLHGKDFRGLRSTFLASGKVSKFQCRHTERTQESSPPLEIHTLTKQLIDKYPCSPEVRAKLEESTKIPPNHPNIAQVSESNFVVFGPSRASNTVGYCHVKVISKEKKIFSCCSKTCPSFISKAKQVKSHAICCHLHILFCCLYNVNKSCPPVSISTAPGRPADDSSRPCAIPSVESSVSRGNTLKLASSRSISYSIPKTILHSILTLESATVAALPQGWPDEFSPTATSCQLCNSPLPQPRSHPGQSSENSAVLITHLCPFWKVKVLVKMCTNANYAWPNWYRYVHFL